MYSPVVDRQTSMCKTICFFLRKEVGPNNLVLVTIKERKGKKALMELEELMELIYSLIMLAFYSNIYNDDNDSWKLQNILWPSCLYF